MLKEQVGCLEEEGAELGGKVREGDGLVEGLLEELQDLDGRLSVASDDKYLASCFLGRISP